MDDEEEVVEETTEVEEVAAVQIVPLDPPKYEVRPGLGEKFMGLAVQEIIHETMRQQLLGRSYSPEDAAKWSRAISNAIRERVQDLAMKRYKIVVAVSIVEMRGAGIKMCMRCLWDPETDSYVADAYRNETMFCHTTVYGVYLY